MYSILFLTMVFLSLAVSSGLTKNDVKSQAEREISQLFFQKLPQGKKVCNKTVPSFLKKLYKMPNRLSTFSQVLCVFSEEQKRSRRRLSFSFDLSDIENLSEASQVKLHAFKRRSKLRNELELYYIHLYQIFESNNNASHGNKRLLSSRFVRQSHGEWLDFDVTARVNSQENLLTKTTTTKLSFSLEVEVAGVRGRGHRSKSKPVSIAKSGRKQPFLLVFFQKSPDPLPTSKVQSLNKFPFARSRFPRASSQLCSRRESLYIDFHKLGLNTIILPYGYEAYYCDGACPIFSGDPNQSLYSFLRNRRRLEGANHIPAACCVPTQLKPLMVMYYSAKGVIVDTFQGMIVSSCACR